MSVYQSEFGHKIVALAAPNRFLRITDNYRKLLSLSKKSYENFLLEFEKRFQINPETFNSSDFVQNIHVPLGIIHDDIDTIVPYKDSMEILEKNPDIPLFTTSNLGHSLYHQSVNKQIVYFLKNNRFKL